jgi:filamentous hemagglutinin family protein
MSKDMTAYGKTGHNVSRLLHGAERTALGWLQGIGRLGGWSKALSGALIAAACSPALAGPEGARVVRGSVDISRDGTQTLIRASNNSIINYRSFNIGANESVRFIQPNATSRVLNRITTATPTRIDGTLTANGRVYIVNPAGVIFGNGASLNTAGLYAAAGHISDKDFVRGINHFTGLQGEVVNNGAITADFVGLVGKHAANLGSIVSPQGTVIIGSGSDALVGERSGNIFVRLTGPASAGSSGAATDNAGTINARGGQVIMGAGDIYAMAVRTTGSVTAKNISIEGQQHGLVVAGGEINAKDQGAGATGGRVDVLGEQISVINAKIDASGANGGGTVRIGGDYQGKGALPHAKSVYVDSASSIDVSATGKGNGGTAVAWSDNYTQFFGSAAARGGAAGGDGGLIETSSHKDVNLSPVSIDASAASGKGGQWLIDPRDLNITTNDVHINPNSDPNDAPNPITYSPDTNGNGASSLNVTRVNNALNTRTSVTITTANGDNTGGTGNVDIQQSILKSSGTDSALTIIAMGSITLEAGNSISSTSNKLDVTLTANNTAGANDQASGSGGVILNGAVITNGGIFSSSGVGFTSSAAGTINTTGATNGAITLAHTGAISVAGAITGGSVNFAGAGTTTLSANITTAGGAVNFAAPVILGSGVTIDTTSGVVAGADITFTGTVEGTTSVTQDLTLNAGTGGNISASSIGAATRLRTLTFTNANNITTGALRSQSLVQTAGGGTTTVNGAIDTTGGINLTGTAINLTSTVNTGGTFGLIVTNSGQLTLGGTLTLDGALTQSGGGAVALGASISTTNDAVGFANNVTVGAPGLSISTGTGTIAFGGNLTLAANSFTLAGNEINFLGGANSVTGTGTITLGPGTNGTVTNVANAVDNAGVLDLTTTDLAALADGFAQITIGRPTGSEAININAATFSDPVLFQAPGGGTITVSGNLAGAVGSNASISFSAASAVHLGANITTDSQLIQFSAPVQVTATATLDTTNSGGSAGAGINVTGAIDAATAGTQGLTLRAGTGSIVLSAAVGGTRLGAFTITSAADVTTNTIAATTITQTAGTGTSTFGALNTSAAGGVSLTGNIITLSGATTTNSGTFTVNNSGQLTVGAAALSLDGAFHQTGVGATTLSQAITTTNDSITFAGNVTVGAAVGSVNAGTATASFGGNVALGANAFTVSADTIQFNGGANSVTGTSTITLEGGADTTNIGVFGGVGTLQLTSGTLGALANGFSQVIIGQSTGVHNITIGAGTFQNPVNFRTATGTIDVVGDLAGTGSASITMNGPTKLEANITTSGQPIQINGAVTVVSLSNLDTTNGAPTGAAIGITGAVNGFTAGADILTLNSGTSGSITLGGAVGGGVRLATLEIMEANNVNTGAITADEITQDTGVGTTTLGGLLTARAAGINLAGNNFAVNGGAGTSAGGAMTVNNAGTLSIASAVALDGAFSQTGAGAVNISAALTTTNDAISFAGPVTVGGAVGSLDAGTATITIGSTLALGANNFTLAANDINFNGGANSVTGTGAITLEPGVANVSIGLGGAAGTFTPDLTALHDGFSQIIIGRADGSGDVHINASTYADPITIRSPLGTVFIDQDVHGTDNATLTFTGASVVLAGNLVTDGNAIQINGPVTLAGGGGGNIDSTNAGGFTGAAIGISGDVNGTAAGSQSLVFHAGLGDISLGGNVGGLVRLNAFTIANAHNVTGGAVAARSILQITGLGATPTTTFTGLLDSSIAGVSLTTNTVNLSGGVTTANGAGVVIDNSGLLTISGAAWTLDGTFTQSGGGGTHLGANITTTGDTISFADAVTMTGASVLTTAGGDVDFLSTLEGGSALTVAAGTGLANFTGNVGAPTPLGVLTVSSSGGITFSGTLAAQSAQLTSTGAVVLTGDVTTPGGFSSTGTTFANAGSITTTNNDITIDHSGAVTVNGDMSAGTGAISLSSGSSGTGNLTFGAGVDLSADTIALGAGNGAGAAIVDALTNLPQFHGSAGGATSPSTFVFRQDAAITTSTDLPTLAQFGSGSVAGVDYSLNSTNGVVTVDDATRIAGSALSLSGTGPAATGVVVNTDLTLAAFHAVTGVTLNNNVTTTAGDILLDGPARTLNSITLNAGSGQIAFGDTLAADGLTLTLTASDLDFGGVVTPGAPGGLFIQTSDPAHSIFLGGTGSEGSGDMHLVASEIANIGPGFSNVTIGGVTQSGSIHVVSPVTFSDRVNLQAPTTILAGDILTNGTAVNITGNVTVAANSRIDTTNNNAVGTGADVSIQGTTDADAVANNRTLVLNGGSAGNVALGADVGDAQRLATFTAAGATVSLHTVKTLGAQNYAGAMTLNGNLDLGAAGAINILGPLTLAGDAIISTPGALSTDNINTRTINSDGTARSLTLSAGGSGHVTTGVIGGSSPLSDLTATGSAISVAAATTSNGQTYNGPLTIFGNLTGTSINVTQALVLEESAVIAGSTSATFGGTVRSQLGEHNSLTINSPTTVLDGSVGDAAGSELGTLTLDAGGLANIHSAVINTIGAQSYGDATTVFEDLAITAGGDVTFGNTLNSGTTARALTINSPGATIFSAGVGTNATSLFSTITTDAPGTTRVGGNIGSSGTQTFNDDVVLTNDVTFDGANLAFAKTINSDGTARSLTMNAHTGAATVGGLIGGASPISTLGITGATASLVGATTTGAQSVTGDLTLAGNLTSTTGGSIDITGALNLAGDSVLATAGGASDHINVTGAVNSSSLTAKALTINAGAGNVSLISNTGLINPLSALTITGTNLVAHAVTTTGAQTYTGSLTVDNNLTSTSAGAITVNGAFKIDADVVVATTVGGVTFNGTVDSGLSPHGLTVNTGGNGLTRFVGAVGGISALTTLTTNADGATRIEGGSVNSSGDQTYADNVILGADTTLTGKNLIFQGTLDSDGTARALTANSSSTGDTRFQGVVGGSSALSTLTTNADGTTKIGANITTTSGMTFADAVTLTGNSTLNGGGGTLFFQKTIDADTTATDPLLTLLSTMTAGADATPFKFGGNIGSAKRLGGLTIGGDISGAQAATIIFTDSYDVNGRIQASGIASTDSFTITTGNAGFTMGRGQKLTSFGALNIVSAGNASIGDLTSLTTIKISANQIIIKLRSGGQILDNVFETPNDQLVADAGVDIVAAGTIDFNVVPKVLPVGSNTPRNQQPTDLVSFANDAGDPGNPTNPSDPANQHRFNLATFTIQQFTGGVSLSLFADTRTGHSGQVLPLDLKSIGPSVTSIASSIAGAIPRDTETREVATPVTVGKGLARELREMGVSTKELSVDEMVEFMVGRSMYRDLPLKARPALTKDYKVTVNRLSMSTVEAAVEAYRRLVLTPQLDDNGAPMMGPDGQPVMVKRTETIKGAISDAWDAYAAQAQEPDGAGFRAYLESRSATTTNQAEKDALAYLKSAREVLDRFDGLGLSPFEASIPKRKLIGEIRPTTISPDQFQAALSGGQLSMR